MVRVHIVPGYGFHAQYRLTFQLSSSPRQALWLAAPTGGLQLAPRDVNRDRFVDVVVTTAWTNQPVAVLLNDGRGHFSAANPNSFPWAFSTSGDSLVSTTVEIIDATAALLSRHLLGHYEQTYRVSTPHRVTAACVSATSRSWLFYTIESIRNRPPPLPIHLS